MSENGGQEMIVKVLLGILHELWFEENPYCEPDDYEADFRRFCEDKFYHILKGVDK